MAEPFSIFSASISLLDVALRAIGETYKFISALRQASAELKYIHRHLAIQENALLRTKALKQSYADSALAVVHQPSFDALDEELKLYVQDLARLRKLLGEPETSAEYAINRFGKRVKSVFQEKELTKVVAKLDGRRLAISEILSSVGRYNELETQKTLKTIQERQESTVTDLKSSMTPTRLQLNRISRNQRQSSREQTNLSKSIVHELSTNGRSLSSIRSRQAELKSTMMNEFSAAHDRLSAIQSHSATSMATIHSLSQHTRTKLDKLNNLDGLVQRLENIHIISMEDHLVMSGSAQDAATSLYLLLPEVGKITTAVSLCLSNKQFMSTDLELLDREYRSLVAAVSIQASRELTSAKIERQFLGKRRPTQPIMVQKVVEADSQHVQSIFVVPDRKRATKRRSVVKILETRIDVDLFIGKVTLFISEQDSYRSPGRFVDGYRILFFPRVELSIPGFSASFLIEKQIPSGISPLLSTFGVLDIDHEVWSIIENGDIGALREFLGDRRVHPNDRDLQYGDSLLGWAAINHQLEIIQLLLLEGADPMDCDATGHSAISLLYGSIATDDYQHSMILDATRALTAVAGADITEWAEYLTWDGSSQGKISQNVVHRALTCLFPSWLDSHGISESYQALELLLQRGGDLDARDGFGRTPLLYGTQYVCVRALPRVMRLLLKYRSNPCATDIRGNGILHILAMSLSVCGIPDMDCTVVKDMKEVFVSLLQRGCEPNLCNIDGLTPSDYCSAPVAWILWCECLEEAGFDVPQVLQKDDDVNGVEFSESDVQKRYDSVLKSSQQTQRLKDEEAKKSENQEELVSCDRCGSCKPWIGWYSPFDVWGGYLLGPAQCHVYFLNHSNGQQCLNYFSRNTCTFSEHGEDGYPQYLSAEEFSWRKHVAYRLWKDGHLGSIFEASYLWSRTGSVI